MKLEPQTPKHMKTFEKITVALAITLPLVIAIYVALKAAVEL